MTSQRYLNDNANVKDFLRSLAKVWIFPAIAFLVLSSEFLIPVIEYVSDKKTSLEGIEWLKANHVISYFGVSDFYNEILQLMVIGMVLCGMLIALTHFSFAFKKNSVNVFFSMGITRTRLYVNRILAGTCELFVASFLPFFLIFIVNVSTFGYHKHQVAVMFYYTIAMFVSGVAGMAITAFASAISGSRIEAILTSFTTSTVFILLVSEFTFIRTTLLKGYVQVSSLSKTTFLEILGTMSSPWTFVKNLGEVKEANYSGDPINIMGREVLGNKVPQDLVLDSGLLLPIFAWVLISAAIIVAGLYLFNKRKAENANSFGKFYLSSAINGAFAFAVCIECVSESLCNAYNHDNGFFRHKAFLCLAIFVILSFIAFFLAELVLRRNIKSVVKMFPVWAVLAVGSVLITISVGTGYFGTFNKLPDRKEIKSVSMNVSDPRGIFNYSAVDAYNTNISNENQYFCESDNPEDIKLCLDYFEKIKNSKYDSESSLMNAEFIIKTKDGEVMARRFPVYSDELMHQYGKDVINSNFFDVVMANILDPDKSEIGEEYQYIEGMDYYLPASNSFDGENYTSYYGDYGDEYIYSIKGFHYFAPSLLADGIEIYGNDNNEGYYDTIKMVDEYVIQDKELLKALYNDLSKMTYDELFLNPSKPLGALALYRNVADNVTDSYIFNYGYLTWSREIDELEVKTGEEKQFNVSLMGRKCILIYPQMTETLKILGNSVPSKHTANVKEVFYADKKLSIDRIDSVGERYNVFSYNSVHPDMFVSNVDSKFNYGIYLKENDSSIRQSGNYTEFVNMMYAQENVKVINVNDSAKAQKIADKSVPVYDTYKDDGRYVFIVYDDGSVVKGYVPEAAISVLK